jgi:two-component system sensor histidine kinase KdpD
MSTADSVAGPHVVWSVNEAVAATAHELRLPLSHIKGFVSALRRTDVEWDAGTRQEYLAEIELEADRLAVLVESLVEAGRPAGPRRTVIDMNLMSPAAVIDGALHRVRGLVRDRVVRRNVATDLPLVRVNVSQMERVVANLLQNAIKYSASDTPIEIAVCVTHYELELVVKDRGPGVPVADRKDIFQPFFRSHPTGAAVPGNGLGLAICQSIVLAHGGRMAVRNRPGGGAVFSVFLPLPLQTSKERGDDKAKHSRRRRRSSDAQTSDGQSESQRLRRPRGSGWHRGYETDTGAPGRPAAA